MGPTTSSSATPASTATTTIRPSRRALESQPAVSAAAVAPTDGTEPGALLRNADLALYEAKRAGRGQARRYRPSGRRASDRRDGDRRIENRRAEDRRNV